MLLIIATNYFPALKRRSYLLIFEVSKRTITHDYLCQVYLVCVLGHNKHPSVCHHVSASKLNTFWWYQFNITPTLHEAQIKLMNFFINGLSCKNVFIIKIWMWLQYTSYIKKTFWYSIMFNEIQRKIIHDYASIMISFACICNERISRPMWYAEQQRICVFHWNTPPCLSVFFYCWIYLKNTKLQTVVHKGT
jgi:hypothetical protein